MFYTSYYAKIGRMAVREDVLYVQISNSLPKTFDTSKYRYFIKYNELVPSWDLVQQYKDGVIDWSTFCSAYIKQKELDTKSFIYQSELQKLANDYGCSHVILLCYESGNCHRKILHGYFNKCVELRGELYKYEL